jgi:hypothetical protein
MLAIARQVPLLLAPLGLSCFSDAPTVGSGGSTGGETSSHSGTEDTRGPTSGPLDSSDTGASSSVSDATGTGTSSSSSDSGDSTSTGAASSSDSGDSTDNGASSSSDSGDSTDNGASSSSDSGNSEDGGPGPCIHIVFVTSTTSQGDLGGLQGADAKCAELGESVGGDQWTAVLSGSEISAAERITVTGRVCNVNGDTIADDAAEWWSASHQNPINVDEQGNTLPDNQWRVWSGTEPDGSTVAGGAATHCTDWSMASGAGVALGDAHKTNAEWIRAMLPVIPHCDTTARLYCFD